MDALIFVIKCFIFSCLIVVFSQTDFQGTTLEKQATQFLQHSKVSQTIRETAQGGVFVINKFFRSAKKYYQKKVEDGLD